MASLRSFYGYVGYNQRIYSTYDRPPFPILNENPTVKEVIQNLQFSDFVLASTIYVTGYFFAFKIARKAFQIVDKIIVFQGLAHTSNFMAISMPIYVSYKRLTGFWDNGLRWKHPSEKYRKFDFTSEYEK